MRKPISLGKAGIVLCVFGAALLGLLPLPAYAQGTISTVAGNGIPGFSGDGGSAISAQLNLSFVLLVGNSSNNYQSYTSGPYGVAVDSLGNLYISDTGNNRIRKVTPDGVISTVAVGLSYPNGVAVDSARNLYISDFGNGRIIKMTPDGVISTVAAGVLYPCGVAVDSVGNVYIGDTGNSRVRKVTPAGVISTVAGTGSQGFSGDGGRATSAQLYKPSGVAVDSAGSLYISDIDNFRIRKVTPDGVISTVAGNGSQGSGGDGGSATSAQLSFPSGIALDSVGNLYMADWGTYQIRKVTPAGVISSVAAGDLNRPSGVAVDNEGNLYIVDSGNSRIRKVTPAGASVPTINPGAVVNGASFVPGMVPNSWITIVGTNLSSTVDTWDEYIVNGVLPTTLDGVTVSVSGKLAYIYYVSPGQINAVAPDVGAGLWSVTVSNANGTSAPASVVSQSTGPGFFLWAGTYAVATRQDYSWAVKNGTFAGSTTTPAKPGDVIILWGTGFGPTTPAAPIGVQIPSDKTYFTSNPVSVTVGNLPAQVYGTALAPGYAGLYQVAIQIPPTAPDGDVAVVATVGGVQSPGSVLITVQH